MDLEKQLPSEKEIVLFTKQEACAFLREKNKLYDIQTSLTIGKDIPEAIKEQILYHYLYLKTRPKPSPSIGLIMLCILGVICFIGFIVDSKPC